MSQQIYINGEYFSKADAKISVYDHGLLYGDGVFEGMRIYSGKVFRLEQHLIRLWESALSIGLKIPISIQKLADDVNECVSKNKLDEGYIRLVVTRGSGALGLDPYKCDNPQVICIVDKITLYPDELYQNGLELVTAATIRNHPAALSPRIKSLNYLNNILAKMEGLKAGCVEALMLNHEGEVAECTGDNIFIVNTGVLQTPPVSAGVLKGVTRGAVMELAREDGIKVEEVTMTLEDVYAADECFLTGSAAEVVPVREVDGNQIGAGSPGVITRRLTDLYCNLRTQ